MGREKALLEIDGAPLWQRQRDVLRAAGAAEIFLSARPEQAWAQRAAGFAAVLPDAVPDAGPLAGIAAALERSARSHMAVLAIDLPAMNAAWFAARLAECAAGVGVVGRRGEFFEPLAALYPQEFRRLAGEAIGRGEFSVQRAVAAGVAEGLLRVHAIGDREAAWFANWNRAGDFPA